MSVRILKSAVCIVGLGALFVVAREVSEPGRSRADGPPDPEPLSYSGTIEEDGVLVDGSLPILVSLWPSAEGGTEPSCLTGPIETPVRHGHFQVVLDPGCARAIKENPNLWVEVVIGSRSVGRARLRAVPYALEAERASAASGGLALQIVPSGAVVPFDRDACPPGWTEYQPARGRAIVGVNPAGGELRALARGDLLGAEQHALTEAELAAHTHSGTTGSGNPLAYRVVYQIGTGTAANHVMGWGSGAYKDFQDTEYSLRNHTHDFVTNSTGSAAPFALHQPSVALLYCRKD